MKQQIKLFTPAFALIVEAFLDACIDEIENSIAGVEDQVAYFDRDILKDKILIDLGMYWEGVVTLPEGVELPPELEDPQYVIYNYDTSEVGQPLFPCKIPEGFIPEKLTIQKLDLLHKWIEDEVPSLKHEGELSFKEEF